MFFTARISLVSRFAYQVSKRSRTRRPKLASRRLVAENLECRFALAGDVATAIDPLLIDPNTSVAPTADVAPVATTADASAVPTPTSDASNSTSAMGPMGNMPPNISHAVPVQINTWVYLQGDVTDDQDPTGYTVFFSGAVSGTTTVLADHSYSFQVLPDVHGLVSAYTVDNGGLVSNTVFYTI